MLGGADVDGAAAAAVCDLSGAALVREDVPGQFVEVFVSGLGLRSHSPRRVGDVADDELQVGCQ